ncbi:MAG: chemotaxis protein [Burkholderiales bacterium]|jgi:methyl-accepting chemotaxis protein|nr:chemotaxis protein [Burkholderiales bacterium]MCA3162009.1 chemotaxis protein [Burkholderiales bacterium]MCA3164558.1 chemotaxis protein [Burkholderiales bacterium]MCA3164931.1 chemotaxis protein [Burkholderiales bacterium]MCA3169430.1 chemotaxis protein [Burkholderiales bacterium]
MTLKQRIWIGPILAAVAFLLSLLLVMSFSARVSELISSITTEDYPRFENIVSLQNELKAMVSLIQDAVAEGDPDQMKLAESKALEVKETLKALQNLGGHHENNDVRRLIESFDHYQASANTLANAILTGNTAAITVLLPDMQAKWKELEEAVSNAHDEAKTRVDHGFAESLDGVKMGLWATVVCGIVVMLALVISAHFTALSVWRQIGNEPEYARKIMCQIAEGDLSQKIEVAAGQGTSLLSALSDMSQGLSKIVFSVRHGAKAISEASSEIAQGNFDLSARTEQTATNLQGTAQALDHVTVTAQQGTEKAIQANSMAVQASVIAQQGSELAAQVVETMKEIEESSVKIAEISNVIESIAFQTNILALNAAVEAARAGEHGRGFAVVAAEVRNLAERCTKSAKEIAQLIDSSVSKVKSGASIVSSTGDTMSRIKSSIVSTASVIREVENAAGDQTNGISQINQSVIAIDHMTQQNSGLIEQTAAAAEGLKQQAAQLYRLTETFKLSDKFSATMVNEMEVFLEGTQTNS